jgi:hypothetical protein
MGRLVTSGAETNDLTLEGASNNAAIDTAHVRTGARSWHPTAGSGDWVFTGVNDVTYYARAYFYKNSTFDSTVTDTDILTFVEGTPAKAVMFAAQTDGTLILKYGASRTQLGSPSAVLAADTWYRLELSLLLGTGGTDVVAGRIDDVTVASGSSLSISDSTPTTLRIVGSANAWWDDIAINDSAGGNQNSWPGDGREVLLLPISDNAVGTGWTLGTGTAISSNGFGSVDNTPPTGVTNVEAGSDPKQIRNASSNANSNYDANLTTYFNAGIGPKSVINVLVPIVATAAPVSTSAKQGTVGIVSNPTIANIALGAGGTSGAFWSGVIENTYNTGWKISYGTKTYNPAVTVTTSPVMRITQVTSSTRIATVCFMGMYVDYTPGALPGPLQVQQAVNRAASF